MSNSPSLPRVDLASAISPSSWKEPGHKYTSLTLFLPCGLWSVCLPLAKANLRPEVKDCNYKLIKARLWSGGNFVGGCRELTQLVSGGPTWPHRGSSLTLYGTVSSSDYGKWMGKANMAVGRPVGSSFQSSRPRRVRLRAGNGSGSEDRKQGMHLKRWRMGRTVDLNFLPHKNWYRLS